MTKRTLFCALPIRAMNDTRLAASHWRVLSAVCWHARMNRGAGCYAGRKTLARETGLAEAQVSRCVADLVGFGYIFTAPVPHDRRRVAYLVIYGDEPPARDAQIGDENVTYYDTPIGDDPAQIGDEFGTDSTLIGDAPNCQVIEDKAKLERNILGEALSNRSSNKFREAAREALKSERWKRNSAEAGKQEGYGQTPFAILTDQVSSILKCSKTEAGNHLLTLPSIKLQELHSAIADTDTTLTDEQLIAAIMWERA